METLEKLSRDLFRPAFERHGAAYADLLRQWPAIVGEELARVSRPERLSRRAGGTGGERATRLAIRVAPGHALLVEHDKARIVERINTMFGFAFIDGLKVVTGYTGLEITSPSVPQNNPTGALALKVKLKSITDDRLREALMRLGTGVMAQSSRKLADR